MKRVKPYQKEPTEKVNWGKNSKKDGDKSLFKKKTTENRAFHSSLTWMWFCFLLSSVKLCDWPKKPAQRVKSTMSNPRDNQSWPHTSRHDISIIFFPRKKSRDTSFPPFKSRACHEFILSCDWFTDYFVLIGLWQTKFRGWLILRQSMELTRIEVKRSC